MSEVAGIRIGLSQTTSEVGARRFERWSALAAMVSPFVALFGFAVGVPILTDDLSESAGTASFTVATVSALAVLVMLSISLIGLFLRQEAAFGGFGTAAFVIAQAGTMLASGGAWDQVFTVPYLADKAPAVVDGETSGSLLAGFLISFALLALGWLLFSVASLRARVLPQKWCVVLLIGALLALFPAPTALRLLPLAVGTALLTRADEARRAAS